jgi:branched-chain amino acid transport system ATP-binding protein
MSAMLEVRGLDAGYNKHPVVRGLDMAVASGEVVAFLGPNGAGKTTTLLTLAGLVPGIAGEITVAGENVRSGQASAASKAGVVLVPDDRALFTTLTVTENLRLAGRKDSRTAVDEVFDLFPGLANRAKLAAGQLSGGEQQMLAIGRAMMQDPKVLLIDELSMGLAPIIVQSLLPIVRRIADETGAAVILVEQHVQKALTIADSVLVLVHGKVAMRATPAEVQADPGRLERVYLGEEA